MIIMMMMNPWWLRWQWYWWRWCRWRWSNLLWRVVDHVGGNIGEGIDDRSGNMTGEYCRTSNPEDWSCCRRWWWTIMAKNMLSAMMQVRWPILLSLWIATIVTVHCMAGLDCCLAEQAHDVLVHLRHHHHHQRNLVYASMQDKSPSEYSSCLHPWYYLVGCFVSHCQFKWHHGCFSGRKGQAVYVQFLWRFSIALWDSTFVSWEKRKMVSWMNVRVYYQRAADLQGGKESRTLPCPRCPSWR